MTGNDFGGKGLAENSHFAFWCWDVHLFPSLLSINEKLCFKLICDHVLLMCSCVTVSYLCYCHLQVMTHIIMFGMNKNSLPSFGKEVSRLIEVKGGRQRQKGNASGWGIVDEVDRGIPVTRVSDMMGGVVKLISSPPPPPPHVLYCGNCNG